MKFHILIVAAAGLHVGVLPATDMFVGAGHEQVVHVAEGDSETFSGWMAVSDEGSILKTGLGTWTLPGSLLLQHWAADFTVAEGSASFCGSSGGEPEVSAPSVLDKALIWVSAKDQDATHFEKDGDELRTWYDVRETDVSNTRYLRAVADHTHAEGCPTVTTKGGFESVYFGGLTSGKAMKFYRPGSTSFANFSGVYHIFAVVGNYASQGAVFGSGTSDANFFYTSLAGMSGYNYANASQLSPSTQRSRVYVNGVRFDAYQGVSPKSCFHLLDVGGPVSGVVGSFYAQNNSKSGWGGDYLAEAIAFTNELSEVERVQVASYLSRKWFGSETCVKNVSVVEGASVAIDTTGGEIGSRDVNLIGKGQLVKRGASPAFFRAADVAGERAAAFEGSVKIEAGALDMSTLVPISIATGGELATAISAKGDRRVTVSVGGETFVKSGTGDVAVVSIPSSVNTLTVSGGVLDIRPPRTGLADVSVRKPVAFINPGFETYATDEEWTEADGVLEVPSKDANVFEYQNGWRRCYNKVRVFNFDKWLGTGGTAGATHDAWGIKHHPHEGNCAGWLASKNAMLATPVTISETGVYEVALDVYCIEAGSYFGGYATVSLLDTATQAEVANFGRIYAYDFAFRRVALRANVNSTGAFELQIHLQDEDSVHPVIVDNFEMELLPECEAASSWPVPGGNFEYDQNLFGDGNRTRVTTSPIENVTLNQGSGRASIVTMATRNETEGNATRDNVECNASRVVETGFRQLQLAKDACSATITATPPAGTYLLQADAARYYQYAGAVTATIQIGAAEPLELGAQVVSQTIMKPVVWPIPFTVDGSTAVTITFAFARSENSGSEKTGAWIDDVRLVGASAFNDRRNYLSNGDFEAGIVDNWAKTSWTKIPFASSQCNVQPYAYRPDVFSSDPVDGVNFLYLERGSGAAQSVNFDRPGVYRLSFYSAVSRRAMTPGEIWYNVCTPVCAWLAQGSVTNVIGTTGPFAHTNFVQTVWDFKVPEAGEYVFGLQGMREDVKYSCGNVCIDAVSIRRLDGAVPVATASSPVMCKNLSLSVAKDAKLRLTFDGTNKVDELRLGGRRVSGIVSAQTHPEFIEGMGVLEVDRKGMVLVFR